MEMQGPISVTIPQFSQRPNPELVRTTDLYHGFLSGDLMPNLLSRLGTDFLFRARLSLCNKQSSLSWNLLCGPHLRVFPGCFESLFDAAVVLGNLGPPRAEAALCRPQAWAPLSCSSVSMFALLCIGISF